MQNAKENSIQYSTACKPAFVQYNTVQVLKIELSRKELRVENNKKSLRIEATTTALQAFVNEIQSHVETARKNFANREAAAAASTQQQPAAASSSQQQYSTVQYRTHTVQYSTTQYSTVLLQ
jgi:hypothetical protein